MDEAAHFSIGEVLSLLQEEFPDVTISKIRFLESQGLLDPDRTPSGYRKFFDADVERLRWILRQQREHFLPLKVIKDRLDESAPDLPPDGPPEQREASAPTTGAGEAPRAAAPRRPRANGRNPLDAGPTEVTFTIDELSRATGLTSRQLGDLSRFGLITPRTTGGATSYDGDALVVASAAAAFLEHGVEARHLRMYKVAAEREAALFEQVLLPLLKARGGERARAADLLGDLAALGEDLRAAMLREALREHLG